MLLSSHLLNSVTCADASDSRPGAGISMDTALMGKPQGYTENGWWLWLNKTWGTLGQPR